MEPYFAVHPIEYGVLVDFITQVHDPILKLRAQPAMSVRIKSNEVQIWGTHSCYLHLDTGTTIPFTEIVHSRRPAYIVSTDQEVRSIFHWEVNWPKKSSKNPKSAECLVVTKGPQSVMVLIKPNQRTVDIWHAQELVIHDGVNIRRFPESKPQPDIRADELFNRGEIIPFIKNNAS